MKSIYIALSIFTASLLSAQGANAEVRESWTLCKTEIRNLYGDDARLRLWDIKNRRSGERVQVIVTPKNESRLSVHCNVVSGEVASIIDPRRGEMYAATAVKK